MSNHLESLASVHSAMERGMLARHDALVTSMESYEYARAIYRAASLDEIEANLMTMVACEDFPAARIPRNADVAMVVSMYEALGL